MNACCSQHAVDTDRDTLHQTSTKATEARNSNFVHTCLYTKANLYQQKIKFLVDTGSPYSILSQEVFKKISGDQTLLLTDCQSSRRH